MVSMKLSEENVSDHFTCILFMKGSHLCIYMHIRHQYAFENALFQLHVAYSQHSLERAKKEYIMSAALDFL